MPGLHVVMNDITKHYGALKALDGVSIELRPGRVYGLVGPNGSGKSTLMKCLSGVVTPDEGTITVDGQPLVAGRHRDALAAGIVLMPQELCLVPGMTVEANVMLGHEPSSRGFCSGREARRCAIEALDRVGMAGAANRLAKTLSSVEQRLVMLAAALARGGRLLILDEPTAGLPQEESEAVTRAIASLAGQGSTIVLVSHHLDEVVATCSTVIALRDGQVMEVFDSDRLTRDSLVGALMAGAVPAGDLLSSNGALGEVVLELDQVSTRVLRGVCVQARSGEVVGVVGLLGSGIECFVRLIAGLDRPVSGTVRAGTPSRAISSTTSAAKAGVSFVTGNRKSHIIGTNSIGFHVGLDSLKSRARMGFISPRRERSAAREGLASVQVLANEDLSITALSGGNQQRALLAKTLVAGARVVVVHEPTVGVDIAARDEVRRTLRRFAEGGAAVLVVSADPEEVLGLADRIVSLRRGLVSTEMPGTEATEEKILAATL